MSYSAKRVSRRYLIRLVVFGAAGTALAGCAQQAPTQAAESSETPAPTAAATAAPTAKPVAQPVEIRWACYSLGEAREKVANDVAADFNAKNPDVQAKLEWRPGQQYWDKIITEFAAGTAPDVSVSQVNWLVPGAARGLWLELSSYVDRDKINKDEYFANAWDQFVWKDKLWSVVLQAGGELYFYDKSAFEEAGLKPPTNEWTYDELLAAAKTLTRGEGLDKYYGYNVLRSAIWGAPSTYMLSWGGKVLSDELDRAVWYDDPKSMEAIQFMVDMRYKHEVWPTPQAMEGLGDPFLNRRAAITEGGTNLFAQYTEALKEDLASIPSPNGTAGRHPAWGASGWGALSSTKNKEESWILLRYFLSEEYCKRWAAIGVPSMKSVAYDEHLRMYPDMDLRSCLEALDKDGRGLFATPDSLEWWDAADQELAPMWTGEKSVDQAMKDAQAAVNEIFSRRPPEWEY